MIVKTRNGYKYRFTLDFAFFSAKSHAEWLSPKKMVNDDNNNKKCNNINKKDCEVSSITTFLCLKLK